MKRLSTGRVWCTTLPWPIRRIQRIPSLNLPGDFLVALLTEFLVALLPFFVILYHQSAAANAGDTPGAGNDAPSTRKATKPDKDQESCSQNRSGYGSRCVLRQSEQIFKQSYQQTPRYQYSYYKINHYIQIKKTKQLMKRLSTARVWCTALPWPVKRIQRISSFNLPGDFLVAPAAELSVALLPFFIILFYDSTIMNPDDSLNAISVSASTQQWANQNPDNCQRTQNRPGNNCWQIIRQTEQRFKQSCQQHESSNR